MAISETAEGRRQRNGAARRLAAASAIWMLSAAPITVALLAHADPKHDDEIEAFAFAMAATRTATEKCPGMTADDERLEGLRQYLHVTEADHDVFARQAHAFAESAKSARARAANREAWCDDVYALFGPQGAVLRGALQR